MQTVLVIIQARMGSTRLPGKILMPLGNSTIIECLIHNLTSDKYDIQYIVATSTNAENDKLEEFLKSRGIAYFRGAENDVLSRFIEIASKSNVDYIVRATADDPLMSGECLDILIDEMDRNKFDYTFMTGLPIGVSPEVIRKECFDRLKAIDDLSDRDREHVTIYLKEHPELFKIGYIEAPEKYKYPTLSMTIDTIEQYNKMKKLYDTYGIELSLAKAIDEINEN